MFTAFDVGVAVLVLLSAVLATARGFTREVLSLATWAGSAAIAVYAYLYHREIARGYINEEIVADIVTVLGTFIVALIILHLITMRIADFVVDSRIGPLDRTLGFVFGVARGVLIAVVGVVFLLWLIPANSQPWLSEARSRPFLENLGNSLIAALPPDLERQVTDILQRGSSNESPDEGPGTPVPDDSTDLPEDGTLPGTPNNA